jgi:2',3'-cyclic-nucleotide 2'-phosphodiesterase (5'-nucleotidase family)
MQIKHIFRRIKLQQIKARNISLLFLLTGIFISSCQPKYIATSQESKQYIFSPQKDSAQDLNMLQLTQPYRDSLARSMNRIIANVTTPLTKELPEGNLGNFCADGCMRVATLKCIEKKLSLPDFLFLNHGGLRASIPAGEITVGNIYEVMPFENELVMMRLTKNQVDTLLNFIAKKGGAPVSGIRFKIENEQATQVVFSRSNDINQSSYTVITSDYLANGGDGFEFLKAVQKTNLDIKVRDALIQDFSEFGKRNEPLNIMKDGRIYKN